ncbi:GlxA family transcriptional regulator [Acerihabitans arboris]|uniref:Helix-turn-helix domain-containing protein n=1 Tax=Acerihabitans arboris TaxID=2691583 RepID=A0A845SIN3_9GAMM|nr:GlxA family transcriptional regulator [Acerihabitans arboris]NDL62824.1 helix-turn-helix domain-containing protein [Acerihabitans arboris]
MHIGFFVFADFQLLDLTGPVTAFQIAGSLCEPAAYTLSVFSLSGGAIASSAGVTIDTLPADSLAPEMDTLILCGGHGVARFRDDDKAIRRLAALAVRPRRVASVCTGAFLLAGMGLLAGKRATTHWRHVARLQKAHPQVRVDGDKIFIRDGRVWTSAGITSGIDLSLALIEDDLGQAASREVAREMVVYQRRTGGQSQFSPMLQMEPDSGRIKRALDYAQQHLRDDLSVDRLAQVACLSRRQFSRAFKRETGESPARAVERLRVEAARARVEQGSEPIDLIAKNVGFINQERMRRAFLRCLGLPPQAIKRLSRAPAGSSR